MDVLYFTRLNLFFGFDFFGHAIQYVERTVLVQGGTSETKRN